MTRLLVVAAALAAALVVPATAGAHTTLEEATPATQSRVSAPPKEIRLRFNSQVTVTSNAIRVYAPEGRIVSGAARLVGDNRVVVARVSGLARGSAYTVRWRVTGSDSPRPGNCPMPISAGTAASGEQ